jgi:hypothetical protein
VTPAGGASAVPAGDGSSLSLPGGSGHHARRYYGRRGRCSLDWDRKGRVTPSGPRPRKPGLELSQEVTHPLARAAVERREASALRLECAAAPEGAEN